MAQFSHKAIAITGGASGIGLSLAKLLASRGALVTIADVSKTNLEKAAASIKQEFPKSEPVLTQPCDVRDPEQTDAMVDKVMKTHGKLDGAANVAGIVGKYGPKIHEMQQSNWDAVIGVNLTGVMNSMRSELKVMKSGASIVNCGSTAGFHGLGGLAAYSVAKHGVHGLTRTAAHEYGHANIRINAVAPGYTWTPMQQEAIDKGPGEEVIRKHAESFPLARMADPIEIARVFAFLLSDESSFMTGSIASVDGGWHT